jgi:hypothetical protein
LLRQISNTELTSDDIPPPGADAQAVYAFAGTFDGYDYVSRIPKTDPSCPDNLFVRLGRLANPAFVSFRNNGSLPGILSELRACLFYESRRRRFIGGPGGFDPDQKYLPYSRALVEAIREKLRAGQIE